MELSLSCALEVLELDTSPSVRLCRLFWLVLSEELSKWNLEWRGSDSIEEPWFSPNLNCLFNVPLLLLKVTLLVLVVFDKQNKMNVVRMFLICQKWITLWSPWSVDCYINNNVSSYNSDNIEVLAQCFCDTLQRSGNIELVFFFGGG